MPTTDRISFDTSISATVQSDITTLIGRLESLIATRDAQVAAAMSDFQADGVSEDYYTVEQRWRRASDEVRAIIALVRQLLSNNDETATFAQSRARTAVTNIG